MKMFFVGMVTVWTFNLVVQWLYESDKIKNETTVNNLMLGAWGILLWTVITAGQTVHSIYSKRNYKALMVDPNGELCYCNSSKEPEWLMEYDEYEFARDLRHNYKPEDGWRKRDCTFGMVSMRYVPKHVLEKEQAYEVDKEIIRKAKENYAQFE